MLQDKAKIEKDPMRLCIEEEPALVGFLFAHKEEITKSFSVFYMERDIKKVYFSGQASGMFIAQMIKPFMECLLQVEVSVKNPAYFLNHEAFNTNGIYKAEQMMMICPAHSGSTTGPIQMAKICREKGIGVVCTTYDRNSPLARLSDVVIDKRCGPEESYIETRGHIASMTILYLCIIETAYQMNKLEDEQYQMYMQYFAKLPKRMECILEDTKIWYAKHGKMLRNAKVARYIGFGPYYPLAKEGGLKIAEATSISSLAYELEEFMHTGTTQIKKDTLFFLIAPNTWEMNRMKELYGWCKAHSNNVVFISAEKVEETDVLAFCSAFADDAYLSVLEYMLPFQMLACLCAKDLGYSTVHAPNDGASAWLGTHV